MITVQGLRMVGVDTGQVVQHDDGESWSVIAHDGTMTVTFRPVDDFPGAYVLTADEQEDGRWQYGWTRIVDLPGLLVFLAGLAPATPANRGRPVTDAERNSEPYTETTNHQH